MIRRFLSASILILILVYGFASSAMEIGVKVGGHFDKLALISSSQTAALNNGVGYTSDLEWTLFRAKAFRLHALANYLSMSYTAPEGYSFLSGGSFTGTSFGGLTYLDFPGLSLGLGYGSFQSPLFELSGTVFELKTLKTSDLLFHGEILTVSPMGFNIILALKGNYAVANETANLTLKEHWRVYAEGRMEFGPKTIRWILFLRTGQIETRLTDVTQRIYLFESGVGVRSIF